MQARDGGWDRTDCANGAPPPPMLRHFGFARRRCAVGQPSLKECYPDRRNALGLSDQPAEFLPARLLCRT